MEKHTRFGAHNAFSSSKLHTVPHCYPQHQHGQGYQGGYSLLPPACGSRDSPQACHLMQQAFTTQDLVGPALYIFNPRFVPQTLLKVYLEVYFTKYKTYFVVLWMVLDAIIYK